MIFDRNILTVNEQEHFVNIEQREQQNFYIKYVQFHCQKFQNQYMEFEGIRANDELFYSTKFKPARFKAVY